MLVLASWSRRYSTILICAPSAAKCKGVIWRKEEATKFRQKSTMQKRGVQTTHKPPMVSLKYNFPLHYYSFSGYIITLMKFTYWVGKQIKPWIPEFVLFFALGLRSCIVIVDSIKHKLFLASTNWKQAPTQFQFSVLHFLKPRILRCLMYSSSFSNKLFQH